MATVVILNSVSPSKLADGLEVFGHRVWEALAVSEVLFLCEQHSIDAVIIAADVEHREMIEKQLPGIVMRLQKNADAAYLDSEPSLLFPRSDVQSIEKNCCEANDQKRKSKLAAGLARWSTERLTLH